MANSVKINVDVVTNITGQEDVKKLQDSLNALNSANASRAKSEKAASASKQRSIIQIAEEIAAENKKRQIQIDAYNASIAAHIKEASSLSNITRLSQHKASIELEAAKQKKNIIDSAAKQEKSAASETQKAQKYAYKFTAIEVKMGVEGAKARAKAEKEAAKEAENASKAEIKANNEKIKQEQQLNKLAEQRLDSTASYASSLASKTQSSFSRIKDIALGTLAGIGLDDMFGNIGQQLSTATSNASSIVESENLLRATYNEGADALLNWADKNAEAYGLANASAKQYLSFLTGVLNNTDISSDKLGSMAQNYTRLVGDMASAYNTEIDDAFQAIRSGIAGNTLAMQRYGIVLSVTNLQQYLQSKGIEANYRSLDAASKQYVRYAYIMEHTAEIQGDYTRTSESFANSVKTLKNEWNNFLSLLGQYAIPMLMPIINALRTIIAYAGEVLKYIASIYGWEQYTTIAVDYSYQQAENIEDAVDSQEDLTKEVKNTNKALKSGVKLLDLYSLDFSDASDASSAGTIPEKIPVSAQLEDLANIDYNVPESILPEVNIDPAKVKEIGDTIAGIINGVGVFIEGVKTWLDKPLPNKLLDIGGLVGGLFAWNTFLKPKLSKLPGEIGKWISTSWKDPLKGPILKVFTGLGSVALAGLGGWNLGSALYSIFEEGVVDIPGLISGVLLTVGGLIGAFAAGPAVGLVAAIVAPFAGVYGYIYEAEKAADEAITSVMEGSRSLVDYINEQPAHESIQTFSSEISGLSSTADGLKESMLTAIGEAENFNTAVTVLPEGQTAAEFMTEKYNTLTDAVTDYIGTVKTPVDSALLDTLTGPNGLLAGADDLAKKLEESLSSIREIQKADIAGYREELAELSAKKASGTITDDELERMSFVIEQLKLLGDVADELSTVKYDIDLTTWGASLGIVKSDVETAYDNYAFAIDSYNNDIEYFTQAIEGLDKTSADYQTKLEEYTNSLETAKAGLATTEAQLKNDLTSIAEAAEKGAYAAEKQFYEDTLPAAAKFLLKSLDGDTWINSYKNAFGDLDWRDVVDAPEEITIRQFAKADLQLTQEELDAMTDEQLEDLLFASREMQLLIEGKVSTKEMYYVDTDGLVVWSIKGGIYKDFRESLLSNVGDTDKAYIEDGAVRFKPLDVYVDLGIKPGDILTAEERNEVFKKIENLPEVIKPSTEKAGDEAGNNFTEAVGNSVTSEESTNKMTSAVEEGLTSALENVKTPEEAKKKGSDLAEAITSGVTSGFNTAIDPGSEFMKAADNLTNTLVNIPTKFESAFKSAVNNIAGYINSLVNGLKQQLNGLNLPEGDLTVAQLYNSLKDSNFKIPMLANGGVIPANNPFLAVLGDQKSGVNIEAPVTVIQDAVRNVVNEQGTSDNIEVKVYIGDREIRDFVIDTVTANNLVVG